MGVVMGAANEGYDSDTVAAIAGGLAGLQFGFEELPNDYCQVLLLKNELEQLALELDHFFKGE
jgi:ADP-ribosyl-[dinitrogen reductase] hydrolase